MFELNWWYAHVEICVCVLKIVYGQCNGLYVQVCAPTARCLWYLEICVCVSKFVGRLRHALCVSNLRLYASSLRLCVSILRLCVSILRLCVSRLRLCVFQVCGCVFQVCVVRMHVGMCVVCLVREHIL